jgi:hypothetical protein
VGNLGRRTRLLDQFEIPLYVFLKGYRHFIPLGLGMNVLVRRVTLLVGGLQLLWTLRRLRCEFSGNVLGAPAENRAEFAHGFQLLGPNNLFGPFLISGAAGGLLIEPWIG